VQSSKRTSAASKAVEENDAEGDEEEEEAKGNRGGISTTMAGYDVTASKVTQRKNKKKPLDESLMFHKVGIRLPEEVDWKNSTDFKRLRNILHHATYPLPTTSADLQRAVAQSKRMCTAFRRFAAGIVEHLFSFFSSLCAQRTRAALATWMLTFRSAAANFPT
jgi:hypothetical protein